MSVDIYVCVLYVDAFTIASLGICMFVQTLNELHYVPSPLFYMIYDGIFFAMLCGMVFYVQGQPGPNRFARSLSPPPIPRRTGPSWKSAPEEDVAYRYYS